MHMQNRSWIPAPLLYHGWWEAHLVVPSLDAPDSKLFGLCAACANVWVPRPHVCACNWGVASEQQGRCMCGSAGGGVSLQCTAHVLFFVLS
jgi:hypothetical protein